MLARSLFSAVTRRSRKPLEDSVTEIFAECLRRAPGAAAVFAGLVSETEPNNDGVRVSTQQRTVEDERRRIDLVLEFRDREERSQLVWIEVKLDAGPSGERQLPNYAEDLDERSEEDNTTLVLLTRQGDEGKFDATVQPAGEERPWWPPRAVNWHDVSACLARWAREQDDHSFGTQLVSQFVVYLEEARVAEPGFTLESALVVQHFQDAADALRRLAQRADDEVAKKYERREGHEHRQTGKWRAGSWVDGWWVGYLPKPDPGWRDDVALEWSLAGRTLPAPERTCFAAGLVWDKAAEKPVDVEAPNESWKQYSQGDVWPRLMRFLHPEELVGYRDLDRQVEVLSKWIEESFDTIEARFRS